jgi:cytidyltransferase-like protein
MENLDESFESFINEKKWTFISNPIFKELVVSQKIRYKGDEGTISKISNDSVEIKIIQAGPTKFVTVKPVGSGRNMGADFEIIEESVNEGKMTSAKMVKIFKNTTDWGDMGERVYVKKGNLVVIDSWYYGESKARKQLEDSWNPGGSDFEYWKETYGVELKMVDSFSEVRASGRHKKLTTDGIVGIELEISGGSDKPINEALTIDSPEPGAKKVNIMVGRFQPPTLGHLKVLKSLSKQNGHPVVVFLVRAKKVDPKKAPFEIETTQQMFNDLIKKHSFIEDVIVIDSAAIDKMFNSLRPMYEPILWGTGSDRMKSYGFSVNKEAYRTELNVDPEFKLYEIKRDEDNISASKVRAAIEDDDMDTFKSMTDRVVHSYFPILKTELTGDK